MIVTAACPTEISAQGLMPLAAQPHELEARGSYCHSASLLILETPQMYTTLSIYRGSAHTSTRLEWSYCRVVTTANRVGAIISQRYYIAVV